MISPSNTGAGLTRGGPLAISRGEPEVYYPTGVRNFARVVPREDVQGVAHAMLREPPRAEAGVRAPRATSDWRIAHADPFRRAARRLGARRGRLAERSTRRRRATTRSRTRSRAPARRRCFVAGSSCGTAASALLKALRARLGDRVKIMVTDIFAPVPDLLELAGPGARGVYMSTTDMPPGARELTPAGDRFVRDFGAFDAPSPYVLPAAQAAEVVLDAIARSDGTRASVLEEMRKTEVKDGILGSFRFDRNGDITPGQIPILRITGKTPPGSGLYPLFQGAVVRPRDRGAAAPGG